MIRVKDLRWRKVYKGPFSADLADALVEGIKKVANPETNGIYFAKKRHARGSQMYDVWIQTIRLKE